MRDADAYGATTIVAGAPRSGLFYLWVSALVIALDQASKALIEHHLDLLESVAVLPVLDIVRFHNSGAAFSFLAGAAGWQRWLFTVLAIAVSVALVAWLQRINRGAHLLGTGVALILGGALGNVVDRFRLGHVIDFIYAHWGDHYFPAFNCADSAITIGAALLLLDAWLQAR